MTIPDGLTKLTISGTLVSGAEVWACSLWLSGYDEPPGEDSFDPTTLDGSPLWDAFIEAVTARMGPTDHITAYDSYWYSGGAAAAHVHVPVDHAGVGGGGQLPAQIATVLTLRTATNTRRGRGRIYLPTTAFEVMDTNHKFAATSLSTVTDALAAWMTGIAGTGTKHAVVVSQTAGLSHPITSVSADTIPDTQRRRRNKLIGGVHTATV